MALLGDYVKRLQLAPIRTRGRLGLRTTEATLINMTVS